MAKQASVSGCHVMAKPSGFVCNIDCEYCFYLEKETLYPDRNKNWRMSDETLELFIKQQIDAQQGKNVDIAWQGGEPTLMGLDFFKKIVALSERYKGDKDVHHSIQTNGILLNNSWCEFLKQHNFLVGISIDGPAEIHDHYRKTRSGKPTHAKVMQAIERLKRHHIEFNTLSTVNNISAQYPQEVYHFLKQIGSTYMQFIPLVERALVSPKQGELLLTFPGQKEQSKVTPWSVPSKAYGTFLNTIFDEWVKQDVGRIFIQTFDSTLAAWVGAPAGMCLFAPTCGHTLALEANGDLYSCDHYVYPEYRLGNIYDTDIETMNSSEQAIAFGNAKHDTLTQDCHECPYLRACYGGCPKHRFDVSAKGFPQHNYLCKGYMNYFEHTAPYMATMAKLVQQGQPAAAIMHMLANQQSQTAIHKVGRNQACPCGSGKKYKHCCGRG